MEFDEAEHEMYDGSGLKRQHDLFAHDAINVVDAFGAKGNGTSNDTSALQGALAANLPVYIPTGTYRYNAVLAPRTGAIIRGDGSGATTLKLLNSANVSMVLFPSTSNDVLIEGLTLDGNSSNQSPGGQIHGIETHLSTARCRFRDVSITNTRDNGISLGASNTDIWIENCNLSLIGRSGMYLSGSRVHVSDCTVLTGGSRVQGPGLSLATLVDSTIRGNLISTPTDDCISLFTSSIRNIVSGNSLQGASLNGIESDTTSVDNVFMGNQIYNNLGHGIQARGRNHIVGNVSILNGLAGIKVDGTTPQSRCVVQGNFCRDNGSLATSEQFGIELTETVTDCTISGNICTDTGPGTQLIGIQLNNADFCIVTGNDVRGNVTSGLAFTGGTSNRIYDNIGYNPIGVSAITVTASPFTYTNNDNVPEAVYISGGTISAIAKNSINVFTIAGDATVWLEPGEAVTVTYTVAPTMNKDRK